MTEERRSKKTDLVLSNGEYAFTQDATTGVVKVLSGPTVVNVTGQEYPVVYHTDAQRFAQVELEDAAQKSPMASQGFYIELHNPPATESGAQPNEGSKEIAPALLMGRRVNIPGPTTFSLWPRQVAKVIEGHHLPVPARPRLRRGGREGELAEGGAQGRERRGRGHRRERGTAGHDQ